MTPVHSFIMNHAAPQLTISLICAPFIFRYSPTLFNNFSADSIDFITTSFEFLRACSDTDKDN